MHVLVTGAAGRVGRRVVGLLRSRGDRVTAFDVAPLARSGDDAGLVAITGDLLDRSALGTAVRGVDAVLHLGAFMSWLPADAERVIAVNAHGTEFLLAAARAAGVKRFVLASTGEVYPEVRARRDPVDEDHPCEPISAYGLSKLLAEETLRWYGRAQGMETVILRLAHTQDASELHDPGSFFSGPRFYLQAKIRQQRAFGNARALAVLEPLDTGSPSLLMQCAEDDRPYRMMIADARDIADGLLLALDASAATGRTFNLGPDEPVRFDDATALLAQATGLPVVRARMPGPPVDYATSNARIREALGYVPRYTFAAMVAEARAAAGAGMSAEACRHRGGETKAAPKAGLGA